MLRTNGILGCLVALAVALAASSASAIDFAQHMGVGYGPGYNAPLPPANYAYGGGGPGACCSWNRGCCEVPASWRIHVWDGYMGDTGAWQRSWIGVPQQPYGGYSANGSSGCPTCNPAPAPVANPSGNAPQGPVLSAPAPLAEPATTRLPATTQGR